MLSSSTHLLKSSCIFESLLGRMLKGAVILRFPREKSCFLSTVFFSKFWLWKWDLSSGNWDFEKKKMGWEMCLIYYFLLLYRHTQHRHRNLLVLMLSTLPAETSGNAYPLVKSKQLENMHA